jgi:ribosomal protein S4
MFKILCFKNKNKIKIVRYFLKKYFKTFIYSKNMPKKTHRKVFDKDFIMKIHTLLFFRTYYGDFTIKKFKQYLKRINTRRIDYASKIIFLLESRLDILLYRLNFFKNPREARNFIKSKKILLNNNIINKLNYQLYINDVIDLNSKYKKYFFKRIKYRLKKKQILFNYPKYLEINYKIMKSIFILYPKKKDIPTI